MTLYDALRKELSEARRKMIQSFGTPDHHVYKTMAREIEKEMRLLVWDKQSA